MKLTSNIELAIERTERLKAAAARSVKAVQFEAAKQIADEGKRILVETTQANMGHGFGTSGMASEAMGGSSNMVDMAWGIESVTRGEVVWVNDNPIYQFLNKGTRAHGPLQATQISQTRDRRAIRSQSKQGKWFTRQVAKRLFIPLNEKTAKAYLRGELHTFFGNLAETHTITKGKKKGQSSRRLLEWGVDFVLAKWVRGIAARHITQQALRMFSIHFPPIIKTAARAAFVGELRRA